MSTRWTALAMLFVLLPRLATAEGHDELEPARAAGEDEQLYRCRTHDGPVVVTFKPETELKDLVTWVMGFTCKNFVLDPRIVATGRKVTVIAPNQMPAREAYRVFLVALSTIGLTVVAKGSVMRVVEAAGARRESLPIYQQVPHDRDQMVRVVIRPSHVQAESLKQAFTAVKSDAGDIAAVGSMLVVTDYASALTGMMSLKKLVDVPGGTDGIYTLPVRHGDAGKLAQLLTTMLGAGPAAGKPGAPPDGASELTPSKILVDERTNTLVLSGSEPAYQRARALLDRIDVAVDLEGGGSIHSYQLSSAIAEELAVTLNKAIAGDGPARAQRPAAGAAPEAPGPAPPSSPALDGIAATLRGAVHIVADKPTNKLLVTASSRDFLALKDVIQELDQPRRQVYIEAMILEVEVANNRSFGASAHAGSSVAGSGIGFGGVQLPDLKSTDPAGALTAGGLLGGLFGASRTLLGQSIPSYGLLFQAIADHATTNILATPSIIALDNEEAKAKIGENIPYLRGATPTSTAAGGVTLTPNVERKDLQLELDIKPHISADGTVLLEIKHSAEGLKDPDNALGPTWTTRRVETRVVVRDQQTVLIGGLMQESETDREDKVPVLGDLPLLGYLFKYTSKSKRKTNLLIMLTPYIVKDQLDLQQIQQRKLRQNDEFFRSSAALESMAFQPRIDYRRKRGLIEEISRAVQGVEDDVAARARITTPAGVPEGAVAVPP